MKILLLLLIIVSLLHFTTATTAKPPQAILNAAETLSNSGYNAMSLTLQLILNDASLPLQTTKAAAPPLTIFTPPDSSFESSGQPSLSLLLLHFSPLSLSLSSLSSLPFGTKLPSLSPSSTPLFITSKPGASQVEINNVKVKGSPIYDDGSLIVFAIEDFFASNFTIKETANAPTKSPQCSDISEFSTLFDASTKLKGRGYSIMASFLELQLIGYLKLGDSPLELTMFAPQDQVLVKFSGDIASYSGLLMKHLLPCRLTYADLNGVKNGTVFKDNFEGLSTMIEKTDKDLFVNGVEITFPDMYFSDWLVIHGISDAITQQPDDAVAVEEEELEEEDEHPVPSVSYEEETLSPDANEL